MLPKSLGLFGSLYIITSWTQHYKVLLVLFPCHFDAIFGVSWVYNFHILVRNGRDNSLKAP